MLTLLGGSAEAITFGSQGELLRRCLMQQGCVVQIAQGVWHTVVATAPRTLLLEVKPGPFRPADFAGWAPEEGVPAAQDLLERLQGDL